MYADVQELIDDYLPEHSNDAQIRRTISHIVGFVSDALDGYCRVPKGYFSPAGRDAATRKIRGEGTNYLRLPVHVPGSVTIEGIPTELLYEGQNGWIYWSTPAPTIDDDWTNLLETRIFKYGHIYNVTARWGWPKTPGAITEAVRQITARIFEKRRGVIGETPLSDLAFSEIQLSPFVQAILEPYKRREFQRI